MQNEKEITVLLPFKGESEHIYECIDSIYYESKIYRHTILIYSNEDHSFINRLKIFSRKYSDIEFLELHEDGLANALSAGVLKSKTELIARIDSDDLVLPLRFEKQIDYLSKNKNVAVVGGQVEYIDSSGRFTGISNYPTKPNEVRINFSNGSQLSHPSVMFRKSSILASGNYSKRCETGITSIAEDLSLWFSVLDNFEIANLGDSLIQYRQHDSQVSLNYEKHIQKRTLILRGIYLYSIFYDQKFAKNYDYFHEKNKNFSILDIYKLLLKCRSSYSNKWFCDLYIWILNLMAKDIIKLNFAGLIKSLFFISRISTLLLWKNLRIFK